MKGKVCVYHKIFQNQLNVKNWRNPLKQNCGMILNFRNYLKNGQILKFTLDLSWDKIFTETGTTLLLLQINKTYFSIKPNAPSAWLGLLQFLLFHDLLKNSEPPFVSRLQTWCTSHRSHGKSWNKGALNWKKYGKLNTINWFMHQLCLCTFFLDHY